MSLSTSKLLFGSRLFFSSSDSSSDTKNLLSFFNNNLHYVLILLFTYFFIFQNLNVRHRYYVICYVNIAGYELTYRDSQMRCIFHFSRYTMHFSFFAIQFFLCTQKSQYQIKFLFRKRRNKKQTSFLLLEAFQKARKLTFSCIEIPWFPLSRKQKMHFHVSAKYFGFYSIKHFCSLKRQMGHNKISSH